MVLRAVDHSLVEVDQIPTPAWGCLPPVPRFRDLHQQIQWLECMELLRLPPLQPQPHNLPKIPGAVLLEPCKANQPCRVGLPLRLPQLRLANRQLLRMLNLRLDYWGVWPAPVPPPPQEPQEPLPSPHDQWAVASKWLLLPLQPLLLPHPLLVAQPPSQSVAQFLRCAPLQPQPLALPESRAASPNE